MSGVVYDYSRPSNDLGLFYVGQEGVLSDSESRHGMTSVNTIRMMEALSREGANSTGHYSYDSGVWLGTGVEPDMGGRSVPEPPQYLPPNEMEISITPKPPPEVVCH